MRRVLIFLMIGILQSCINTDKDVITIDPREFLNTELLLSDFSTDVQYIPLKYQSPIGYIFSIKILHSHIYLAAKDLGVLRFSKYGEFEELYGKIGYGPGEYIYCLHFAINDINGNVYVMDNKKQSILIYNKAGEYINKIKCLLDENGYNFNDIEFYKNYLVLAQYINNGMGSYNWAVLDLAGNIISFKKNSYPLFENQIFAKGRLFISENGLGYWDNFKDTVFTIINENMYKPICLFVPGEHRLPMTTDKYFPIKKFTEHFTEYVLGNTFLETKNFFVYGYIYRKNKYLSLIYKNGNNAKSMIITKSKGLVNDIDNGLNFIPSYYFKNEDNEYLVSIIQPYEFKAHILSDYFSTSTPKFPEKKKELEKLANSLNENDNPVLMLVKLK